MSAPFRILGVMRMWFGALLVLAAIPVAAEEVDSPLVGTWQLEWAGPAIYWQIRADGIYRSFGVGARPNEHWGTMTASQGQFSTQSPFGPDGGSYSVNGDVLTASGKLGTASWLRVWAPGGAGSSSTCPFVDTALVEIALGTFVQGRSLGAGCDFRSTIAGSGELSINIVTPQGPAPTSFDSLRRLGSGNKIDVPGVGERAFLNGQSITVLQGNLIIKIGRSLHPAAPDSDTADLIRLGQAVSQAF